jgi:hypothetical protein
MKQLRALYAQTFFTFRTALVNTVVIMNGEEAMILKEVIKEYF